jgi:hypothetical protein
MTMHEKLRCPAVIVLLIACTVFPTLHGATAQETVGTPIASPVAASDLVPGSGIYLGVNLDWSTDSATGYAERFGKSAASYVDFISFPLQEADRAELDRFMGQVGAQGAIAALTVEPSEPLNAITTEQAADLGTALAGYDAAGVPILLRFAEEMNGSWQTWGQQPAAYVAAFRLVANEVRARAPRTRMVWSPAYAGGYPFRDAKSALELPKADFAALDTNGDGQLTEADDGYLPYYPGDDVVDWVGLTAFHWGNAYPWGENEIPERGKFVRLVHGDYAGSNGDQSDVADFYGVYAGEHGKPMMVETAALYDPAAGGDDELAIKRGWWRQVFSSRVARDLPGIKMVIWLEWARPESEANGAVVDWTTTRSAKIRTAFRNDLSRAQVLFAPVAT